MRSVTDWTVVLVLVGGMPLTGLASPLPGRSQAVATCADVDISTSNAAKYVVEFRTNSARLSVTARQKLTKAAACAKATSSPGVHVVGRADPRGSDEDNLRLSRRRAQTVAAFLRDFGVPETVVRVDWKGEFNAHEPDDGGSHFSDRRVAITITY